MGCFLVEHGDSRGQTDSSRKVKEKYTVKRRRTRQKKEDVDTFKGPWLRLMQTQVISTSLVRASERKNELYGQKHALALTWLCLPRSNLIKRVRPEVNYPPSSANPSTFGVKLNSQLESGRANKPQTLHPCEYNEEDEAEAETLQPPRNLCASRNNLVSRRSSRVNHICPSNSS